MLIEGIVKALSFIGKGGPAKIRSGSMSDLIVSQARGKYAEAVENGECFVAANSAMQALSLNNATATGLILSNPRNSGVILELIHVGVSLGSLPAGQSSLILTGAFDITQTATVHTTPLTPRNARLGLDKAGQGKVDSAATIPTPAIVRVLGGGPAATVATSTAFPPFISEPIDGAIQLEPGTCISLQALTTAITVLASIFWREAPIA